MDVTSIMIIGNDLLESLKIDIKYSTSTIEWDGAEIPMKSRDATIEDSYFIVDTPVSYTHLTLPTTILV